MRTGFGFVGMVMVFCAAGLHSGCGIPPVISPDVAWKTELDPPPQPLRVGVARLSITPSVPVFLAGGIPYRPSLGVHDDLWATAIVLDDGTHRMALVSVDLIGLFYDDVVHIRERIAEHTAMDYVLVASTHTHNAPDVLGIWSPDFICVPDLYIGLVQHQVSEAVKLAVDRLRPARLRIATGTSGEFSLANDTRPPDLIDDTLTVWQAHDAVSGETICTSIHFGVHPILIPSFNFDVSSDFVHFLREAVETGMHAELGEVEPQGGICAFFNGPLGGRITPALADRLSEAPWVPPAYGKAQGYGYRLALRTQELLNTAATPLEEALPLSAETRRIRLAVSNPIMNGAIRTCVMQRSIWGGQINSEVGVLRVGPMMFFAVPGMIFPELVIGGAAAVPGSDFPDAAVESPVLADLADGPYRIVIGLANDMCGYIIPKVLYDSAPPFTSDDGRAPYGEIVSASPDAAGTIMQAFGDIPLP